MSTLHWQIREALLDLRDDGRLAVLIYLISRANIRMRCYPGVELIEKETHWSSASVNEAKKWLVNAGAIMLVPHELRIDDELKLPPRQHVYQLTGVMRLSSGQIIPYLFLSPEAEAEIRGVVERMAAPDNSLVSKTSPTSDKGINSIKGVYREDIPKPSVPASMGMRLPKASKREDEEMSYGDEGAKVVAPKSALHVWVLSHVPGTKALAKTSVAKLYQEVLLPDGKTTPPPSALYDNAPLYREWLTAKVLAYFKTQTHESPSGAAKHLINLICRFQAFTDPQHGYFAYVNSVNVLEKAQERQQRATDEIINTVKPDGTGEVPGWMRDADSLDDGVFS